MNLTGRLKAYNNTKGTAPVRPVTQPALHISLQQSRFELHPLSQATLALPPQMARDFRADVAANDLLFFDLETTGLGSSEQTYPFLIGAAGADGSSALLSTWFADTPASEEDMLRAFIAMAENKVLVSFNGKSFDLPLVIRRAEKYGIAQRLKNNLHIDLFHTIRRIFPEKPARLIDAETRLLGFTRTGDLAGAAVAQAYFEYLRFGDTELRRQIMQHNESDVLSLVSLMRKVAEAFAEARRGESSWAYKIHRDKSAGPQEQKQILERIDRKDLDARDLHALGKIHRSAKEYPQAARYFLRAYRLGYAPAIVDAVKTLRRLARRKNATIRLVRYALSREDEKIQRQLVRYLP